MSAIAEPTFRGTKSEWHGFDRYDFLMDEKTLAVTPFTAPVDQGTGITSGVEGKRRCVVIVPHQAAPGNLWSWRGCYWDYAPQIEIQLLKHGFFIVFISPDPGPQWDAWYRYLTEQHGFSKKPAFVGMSKGGVNAYAWATHNPDKVSCIYADNPALYPDCFSKVWELASNDVPLLHVCGSSDFLLEHNTLPVENIYHQLGGRISIIIKEGTAHHPHSLNDPTLIADWIEKNVHPDEGRPPSLPGVTFTKSYYYSFTNSYQLIPHNNIYATCSGPLFTPCYHRYDAVLTNKVASKWGVTGMAIVAPQRPALGNPWVFRADRFGREPNPVDLALLANGYYIVAAPIIAQTGPLSNEWDNIYTLLTQNGFSSQPALEGAGSGAGEAIAWAIQNPTKVSSIYVENPVLRSLMFPKLDIMANLAVLAKSEVPIMDICGSLDPWLANNTTPMEKNYKNAGGKIVVLTKDGVGHYPLGPANPQEVVDFINHAQKN